jgi:5'-methylthioadenosine phosphorylase
MEGPAFSTKAESLLHKSFGFDVVGMTNLPEARLAREAEICYATMALVTDYDAWVDEDDVNRVSTERVLENFRKNIEVVKRILGRAIPLIPEERTCACQEALKNAILTKPHAIPRTTFEKLELIIGKYISLETE